MLSEFGIVKSVWSRCAALIVAASLAACVDDTVAPTKEDGAKSAAKPRVLGFAELTFSGIGTPEFSSSLIVAPTLEALEQRRAERERSGDLRDLVAGDLTIPADSGGGGNGKIQLRQSTPGRRFEFDNVRYLSSTFDVRNAQDNGTAYNTPRDNLTFLAVSTNTAVNQTAVSALELAGGAPAPPELALQVLPSDPMQPGTTPTVAQLDGLQIFTEAEIAAIAAVAPAAVTSVFPYGFVVRNANTPTTTHTLPASPPPGTFDGVIDFAFTIPKQADPADDPQTLRVLMLAVDNSVTELTQGPQEQDTAYTVALRNLATSLNADTVTLLPGGSLPGVSGLRIVCSVRTAGAPLSATAHLVNIAGFQSFGPTPNSVVPNTAAFRAVFTETVAGIGPNSFKVRGLQSGPAFTDTTYAGNGTTTITTPAGNFFAGEEIEIELPEPCPARQVARYRVQSGGPGTFQQDTTLSTATNPFALAIGDLDGVNGPDLAIANESDGSVSVFLNDGTGIFQQATGSPFNAGSLPQSVAIGDLNGDGSLDLAVGLELNGVAVLLNEGGTFQSAPGSPFGTSNFPRSLAIGDLNGDGSLDLVTTDSPALAVLLNDGTGMFSEQFAGPVARPRSVAIGDLNSDGSLDLAAANQGDSTVSVLLNDSTGTFQAASGSPWDIPAGPTSVAIGDLNADGHLDIAVSTARDSAVSVLLNSDGSATMFQAAAGSPFHTDGAIPLSVAIGDLDGINGPDIATANSVGFIRNNASVLLNNGQGTFSSATGSPFNTGSQGTTAVATGDLNGDGSLDLAVVNQSADSVYVLRNGSN